MDTPDFAPWIGGFARQLQKLRSTTAFTLHQFELLFALWIPPVNFTDDLHLTLGGRYFDNAVDVDAVLDVPIYSSPTNPPGVAAEKIDDDGFLSKANMAWDLGDDSMLYGTFSQGYRHAGANAVPTSGRYAENPDSLTFDSDQIDNYERGFKGFYGKHA